MSSINVNLSPLCRQFRFASELKDNNHGNYIRGTIQLPTNLITVRYYRLELSLEPSKDCLLPTHPNLLHLTKPLTFENLGPITKKSWRVSFLLDFYNGYMECSIGSKKVIYNLLKLRQLSTHFFIKQTVIHGLQNKGEMYEISLGPSCVMLTIVKPLQQKPKLSNSGQVSIEDVLSERMTFEGIEESQVQFVYRN